MQISWLRLNKQKYFKTHKTRVKKIIYSHYTQLSLSICYVNVITFVFMVFNINAIFGINNRTKT